MSTKSKNSNASLTKNEIADVKARVERVAALVKRSATAWLEVAKEFADAKAKLSQHAYERFVNDAGFTKAVADKLLTVGKCEKLHSDAYEPAISRTDGWSILYELTKLNEKQKLPSVLKYLSENPNARVTRSVVQNLVADKSATEKTLVLVKITVSESEFKNMLSDSKRVLFKTFSQMKLLLSDAPSCVQFVPVEESVSIALGGNTPQPTPPKNPASPAAAQVLAHVRDSEIVRLAPKALTEREQREHSEAAWQFNILQHNTRRREDASEVQKLKSRKTLTAADEKKLARLEAQIAGSPIRKMHYDPSSEVSIENPTHRFSVSSQSTAPWSYERFIAYIHENNILLPNDGIPDRPEYAEAWCASLGETALTGTPAEKRASKKALKDIEAGEKRAVASGNVSKAPIARAVQAQVNEATL